MRHFVTEKGPNGRLIIAELQRGERQKLKKTQRVICLYCGDIPFEEVKHRYNSWK